MSSSKFRVDAPSRAGFGHTSSFPLDVGYVITSVTLNDLRVEGRHLYTVNASWNRSDGKIKLVYLAMGIWEERGFNLMDCVVLDDVAYPREQDGQINDQPESRNHAFRAAADSETTLIVRAISEQGRPPELPGDEPVGSGGAAPLVTRGLQD